MSRNLRRAFTVFAVMALASPGFLLAGNGEDSDVVLEISDDISVTLTGEIRTRYEWNENLVDFTDAVDDEFGFVPSRARIGFRVDLPRDVAAYIEMQEQFSFGEDTRGRLGAGFAQRPVMPMTGTPFLQDFGAVNPGSLGGEAARVSRGASGEAAGDEVNLYQAYIEATNVGDSMFNVRFGRQEFAFGNEWLLGDNDFYGGASLDGIRGWFNFDNDSRLDLFWIKAEENNTTGANSTDDDTDMYGAYFNWPEVSGSMVGFDVYGIGLKSNFDAGGTGSPHATNHESYWIGGRVYRAPEWGLHFNAELTYQFGDITVVGGTDTDIEAYGFEGSIGYTWDVTGNPDIHGGYTWASGDDSGSDFEQFTPPLQDAHPRLGMADLFFASNIQAIQLGYAGSWENLSWGVELYNFVLDEGADFDGDGDEDDDLATEIDLWFGYQYSKHLSLQLAYAIVMAEDAIEAQVGADNDDASRFYANLVLRY